MNQAPVQGHKKVLFLITKATWGGAQKYVFDVSTSLPNDHFEVEVAFGDRGRLSSMLEERGVKTRYLSALSRDISLFSDIESFLQIAKLLSKVRPDVLHLNSSKAAALGALAGRLAGIPRIITTIHGWPFKEQRNFFGKVFIYFASWITGILSHTVIVVSKRDEHIGKRMLGVGHKISLIPPGIRPIDFLAREAAWARIREMREIANLGVARIVTIAELTKNKGLVHGISAIEELRKRNIPCTYFIIGDGELREKLEEYTIEKQVENDVVFLGSVEHAPELLKAFDVFLLPSIKEGMPYVLLEAAQAGLPIVATDVIDLSFKINHPSVTIVPAHNASLLAEALERAIESSAVFPPETIPTLEQEVEKTRALYDC